MKEKICILEFPSNLGLKEPYPGHEPGVRNLPDFFKFHGFHSQLNPERTIRLDPPPYSMNLDETSGVRNAGQIVDYALEQSELLQEVISHNEFPIVLGGDCSILIGNALGLKNKGVYALFYLDGHTDFMWPSLSETGGAAGMDLAIITGYGHEKLTDIETQNPYVMEEHVWCVGNRDEEDWYVKAITDSNINYVPLAKLREVGISNCIADFLDMVHRKALDGFWIHIDVDVLGDTIMPAVDSRQPDGLAYEEFNEILKLLLADAILTGLEITILDPDLDPDGVYTKEFIHHFCSTFNA